MTEADDAPAPPAPYLPIAVDEVLAELTAIREQLADQAYMPGMWAQSGVCYANLAGYSLAFQAGHPGYVVDQATYRLTPALDVWPQDPKGWRPKNPREDLVKAAAFILWELEQLDRTLEAAKAGTVAA